MRKTVNIVIVFFIILSLISIQPLTSSNQKHENSDLINNQNNINAISEVKSSPEIPDHLIDFQTVLIDNNRVGSNIFFTKNLGQINNNDVKFYIECHGIWFTPNGVIFELIKSIDKHPLQVDKFKSCFF